MSEPFDPNSRQRTKEEFDAENSRAASHYQFTLEDHLFLDNLSDERDEPMTWEEEMQALAKHRGIPREQLPAEVPCKLL